MSESGKKRERAPDRPFPAFSLEECLELAQAIQDSNAGRPINRLLLAKALGRKPGSSEFRILLSSSLKYGLTIGTEKSAEVALTDLGQRITKPLNTSERLNGLQEAALKPPLFGKVFGYFDNAKLPSGEYFRNTLERQFDVPTEHSRECLDMIAANGKLANLVTDISGSPHVMLGHPDSSSPTERRSDSADGVNSAKFPAGEVQQTVKGGSSSEPARTPQIFIAHGRNTVPLDQIKGILDELKVPYKVATEEPNSGRPISEKVANTMKECTSGIFLFTGDERVFDESGTAILRPSENVVFELGAGSTMFGNRIVIFKEEGVFFPTDFRDIGYIPFERQRLSAKATELIRELVGFGILKISAA